MLVALLAILLSAPFASAKAPIRIGFNPLDHSQAVSQNSKRLGDFVKRKTGLAVETFVAKDYDDLIAALASGKADFAFLPPFSFVKAETEAGARVLLKAVRHGRPTYYSAVLVRADSGITKLQDLKGHSMAWVETASAAGYLVPRAALAKLGFEADTFLGKQAFLGTHEDVVRAVLEKRADAGSTWVNDTDGKVSSWRLYLRKPEELAQVKMIFVSDPIPGDAFATTEKLFASRRAEVDKITKAMRLMGEGLDGQQILRDLYGIDQMVPSVPQDFEPIRAAAKAIGLSPTPSTH
jgi:phosphonate transport system substrate-binding protein